MVVCRIPASRLVHQRKGKPSAVSFKRYAGPVLKRASSNFFATLPTLNCIVVPASTSSIVASGQSTTTFLRRLRRADKVSETRSTSSQSVSILCAVLRATDTSGQLRKSSALCRRLKQIIFPLPLFSIPTSYTARDFVPILFLSIL